jgi:hypothetical protein
MMNLENGAVTNSRWCESVSQPDQLQLHIGWPRTPADRVVAVVIPFAPRPRLLL